MKKLKPAGFVAVIAAVCIVIMTEARSEEAEITYFDEQGRLSFSMTDNPAVNTAYKTIAWMIKRYDMPIDHPDNIVITVFLEDESYIGEDGYMHTTIYVSRDEILDKVGECSGEWLYDLKKAGGIIYLDNIMTVVENGVPQGEILEDGSYEGEVYDTFEGISQARWWRNPEDLRQYFDKKVAFPPDVPVCEDIKPVRRTEDFISDFNYSDKGLSIGRAGVIKSSSYDVQTAVPVMEKVCSDGTFSKYGYRLKYHMETGTVTYPIKVNIEYTLKWTDTYGDEYREDVGFYEWYYVQRKYELYAADSLDLYRLQSWTFENGAAGAHTICSNENVEIRHAAHRDLKDASVQNEISYCGGVIDGGGRRPAIPEDDLQWLAEEAVGEIIAVSDIITVDGFEILGKNGAAKPKQDIMIGLSKDDIMIREDAQNILYETESRCVYEICVPEGIEVSKELPDSESIRVFINPVFVRTPVVCSAQISDNRADNQRIEPDETKSSLILGKVFNAGVSNEGPHIDNKGYGMREYNKYVLDNQACFPFDVVRGASDRGETIRAGTWISLGKVCENDMFYLPVTVSEGDYNISFRTCAVNAGEYPDDDGAERLRAYAQKKFNKDPGFYFAYDTCSVYVSGQLSGFTVTSSNDSSHADMEPRRADMLPLDMPPLKLGYEFTFEIMTVGDMEDGDTVCIRPRFYSGRCAEELDISCLYTNEDETERGSDGKNPGDMLEAEDIICVREEYGGHIKYWRGKFTLPKPSGAGYGGLQDTIVVNFDIFTKKGSQEYLSYENPLNNRRGYCNMWKREGFVSGKTRRFGDTAVYDGSRTYMDDYIVVGTH